MIYTFKCKDCGNVTEELQGMNDEGVVVGCIACERAMTRRTDRCYGADKFDIIGETTVGSRGMNWNYMDPTLGLVKNKQDRKDKMERLGLVEYEPNPTIKKHFDEAKRIRSQANPAGDIDAAKASRKEVRAADTHRRKAGIERAFDKVDLTVTD